MGADRDSGDEATRRADTLQEGLLDAQRMTRAAHAELFGDGSKTVAPSLFVDAAEGKPIFRGLNGTRGLIEPLRRAVLAMVQHPERVDQQYRAMLPEPEGPRHRKPAQPDAGNEDEEWLSFSSGDSDADVLPANGEQASTTANPPPRRDRGRR